jgi:membrane protease YdiL (CAAX protease family)
MAALGALALSLLAAIALALFSTEQAVGGSWLERAIIPARMLLLVIAATFLLRWSSLNWRDVGLHRPGSAWRTAGLVVAGYVGIGLIFVVMTQVVFPILGIAPKTLSLFAAVEGNSTEYLYWLLPVAWGSAAFGEELVFRGYLQSRLETAIGKSTGAAITALLLQALIFGGLHSYQGLGGALLAGSTGLVLGAVYLAGRKNLWAPIILHGVVDTVTLTAVFLGVASKVA